MYVSPQLTCVPDTDSWHYSSESLTVHESCMRSTSRYVDIPICQLFLLADIVHIVQFDPTNSAAWIKYAELETQLADYSRARAIFELGVTQSPLSMPELLWKAYIDFEVEEGEREKARSLYERLVDVSGHWKVWVAFALFEAQAMQVPRDERDEEEEEEGDDEEEKEVKMVEGSLEKAREVFQRGYKSLKNKGLKNEVRRLPSLRIPHSPLIRRVLHTACRSPSSLEELRGTTWHRRGCRTCARHDACTRQAPLR